jgi:cellulose synthase/poly-beta-1,6-N-acetylglucosamine synthase-like glycosyltransferase
MSTVWVLIASTVVLVLLWAWTLYHLLLLALGWPHANRALESPFRPESLRNPVDLPTVTIIVAARDEESVVRSTLEDIESLRYPKDLLQVLVAEDGSQDRTREICESFARDHPSVIVLHEDASSGKAAALNRAVRQARGDVLLFLDADTRFEDDLLLKAAKFFHDHPDVDVAQTVIETYADGPNLIAKLDRYESAAWYRGIVAGKDRLGLFVPLCGTGMFIRRRALEQAGPWDGRYLAEDLEMAVRLAAQGSKASMLPAQVWRQPPYTARDFVAQRRRWWGGALQTLPKALRAWRNPKVSWRQWLDMGMQLSSPFLLVGGTAYLALVSLAMPSGTSNPDLFLATLWGVVSSQLLLFGFVVAHAIRRRSVRDLSLIPGIYLYWVLQLYASVTVMGSFVLRRPLRWRVTRKRAVVSGNAIPFMSQALVRRRTSRRGTADGDGSAMPREAEIETPTGPPKQ